MTETRNRPRVINFTAEQIDSCPHLRANHLAVLRLALAGASDSDIAKALGIAFGTVKSRLNRARIALAND